tara:strand:+ start:1898 stop:2074 length:177 start_codon:yes stop_codon:yes gene_type:complete
MNTPDVTEENLKIWDSRNVVWTRDDYLMMRGIAGPTPFLDVVAELKGKMKVDGYIFKN